MKDRLIINKDLIPYTFEILLADSWYEIAVNYNNTADLFTVALYKDGEAICTGEPLIYGKPLFNDLYNENFPALMIIPCDESGNDNRVTYENFNSTVYLCVFNDDDDIIRFCDDEHRGGEYKTPAIVSENISVEAVTEEDRRKMEEAVIAAGGTVTKKNDTATFAELLEGIINLGTVKQ